MLDYSEKEACTGWSMLSMPLSPAAVLYEQRRKLLGVLNAASGEPPGILQPKGPPVRKEERERGKWDSVKSSQSRYIVRDFAILKTIFQPIT